MAAITARAYAEDANTGGLTTFATIVLGVCFVLRVLKT